jgi:hypothetical protein
MEIQTASQLGFQQKVINNIRKYLQKHSHCCLLEKAVKQVQKKFEDDANVKNNLANLDIVIQYNKKEACLLNIYDCLLNINRIDVFIEINSFFESAESPEIPEIKDLQKKIYALETKIASLESKLG